MSGRITAVVVDFAALLQEIGCVSFRFERVVSGAKLMRFVRNRNLDLERVPAVDNVVRTQFNPNGPDDQRTLIVPADRGGLSRSTSTRLATRSR
jgi:hypothetical protein